MRTRSLPLPAHRERARAIIHCLHGPRPERRARRIVTDTMSALGVTSGLADLELVVNELVTNARQHAPAPYELRIFVDGTAVKIAVMDGGADHLQLARKLVQALDVVPLDGESGRGLRIVTSLFPGSWGTELTSTCTGKMPAKQVWITVPRPGADAPAESGCPGSGNW